MCEDAMEESKGAEKGDPREGLTVTLHMKRQLAEWAKSLPTAHLTGLMSRIYGELKKNQTPPT